MKKPDQPPPLEQEETTFRKALGARLRMARDAKELSLRAVGARLGISHGTVGHWETGVNPMGIDMLWRLARMYDTTVLALVAAPMSNDELLALMRQQLETKPPAPPAAAPAAAGPASVETRKQPRAGRR